MQVGAGRARAWDSKTRGPAGARVLVACTTALVCLPHLLRRLGTRCQALCVTSYLLPTPAADNGEEAAAAGTITPRAVGSRQASARGSPQPATSSPAKPSSPTSSDGCRCDATERRFSVKGNWLHGDKRIQLRLRIAEPTGKGDMCTKHCLGHKHAEALC